MGLSIHYAARLKRRDILPAFVEEVADICKSMGWEYDEVDEIVEITDDVMFTPPLDDHKHIHLEGILFHPPNCESVIFTFLSSGWTSSFLHLTVAAKYQKLDNEPLFEGLPQLAYMMHTKTQYSGVDVHISIVKMFKYLEKKYFSEMQVSDEGNYWETSDPQILQERFNHYTDLIHSVKGALEKDGWNITDGPFPVTKRLDDLLDGR